MTDKLMSREELEAVRKTLYELLGTQPYEDIEALVATALAGLDARDNALEQAAQVAEKSVKGWYQGWTIIKPIADSIRALKGGQNG